MNERHDFSFVSSRTECEILKRTTNQLELGFFDRHVHLQLDGKSIGRVSTWSKIDADENEEIECKLTFTADGNASFLFFVRMDFFDLFSS